MKYFVCTDYSKNTLQLYFALGLFL